MAGNGRRSADEALILTLAAGKTVAEAAVLTGLGERTIFRRLNDAEFAKRVANARHEMFSQALGRLAAVTSHAVATLESLLDAVGENVRHNAAKTILEAATRLRNAVEMESRFAAIEEQFAALNKTPSR